MKHCDFCGKEYQGRPDRTTRFCSRNCSAQSTRKNFSKPCSHCGNPFLPPRNHSHQKYCSITCRGLAQTTRELVQCSQCGKQVERPGKRLQQNHFFCCRECEGQWKLEHGPRGETHVQYKPKIHLLCDTCGNTIQRWPSHVKHNNFCSPKCRAEWQCVSGYSSGDKNGAWTGGNINYRGPNWYKQRRLALERDGYKCVRCEAAERLQVHHIRPYQTFDNYLEANDLGNLETLCVVCHKIAEWEYVKAHPGLPRIVPDSALVYVCNVCGSEYTPKGNRSKRCPDCMTLTCPRCGATFRRRPGTRTQKFCSCRCARTKAAHFAEASP